MPKYLSPSVSTYLHCAKGLLFLGREDVKILEEVLLLRGWGTTGGVRRSIIYYDKYFK